MSLRERLIRALHPTQQVVGGNDIRLLVNGQNYFPALIESICNARTSIRLETYLYADDATADQITTELCRAAIRGLDVRVVVDGFGARNFGHRHQPQLEAHGVQVRVFRPEEKLLSHILRWKTSRLRRMHRKIALIDGQIAFVGGINIIGDETGNAAPIRLDFAVRITGPLILQIAKAVDKQWVTLDRLRRRFNLASPLPLDRTQTTSTPSGNYRAAFLLRDNLIHRTRIQTAYVRAISHAEHEIILAMAYFIPGKQILEALLDAAHRGVNVQILLQGRIEYALQHYASQALYTRLLRAGIRIFEYKPGFMHAKAGVIDTRWATVGSANLDPFSLLVAREANIAVHDHRFCSNLRQHLITVMHHECNEIHIDRWLAGPWLSRAMRRAASAVLFRLLSLMHYANNY